MARKKVIGKCRICGSHGKLSFEHIPPEAAFNDLRGKAYSFDQLIMNEPGFRIFQHGIGEHSICDKCNNDTGAWYGSAYVNFVYQVVTTYRNCKLCRVDEGSESYSIYPLRVLKQIITIFFTVNSEQFRKEYPLLELFVREKENCIFDERLRVYAYLIADMTSNRISPGIVGQMNVVTGKTNLFSEFAYPPLGYVITYDGSCLDDRLTDITYFKQYAYDEQLCLSLPLAPLPIANTLFGEYRTTEEIKELNAMKQM